MNIRRLVLLIVVLIALVLLAACGGDDDTSSPVKLDKLTVEGTCSGYALRVKFDGKDDHTHKIQMLLPGTDTVIASDTWGSGGIFNWQDLKCNAEQESWVEDENLCRYEILVVSNTDSSLMSDRKSVDVKCN